MKKLLLSLLMSLTVSSYIWSQCAPSCSNYVVSPITFTTYSGLGGGSGYGANELLLSDDQTSGPLPIGFNFTFMCNTYSTFVVSSNGFISFDTGAPNGCCSGQSIPNTSAPNNLIAIFWNDLYPPGGGTIAYATTGVSPNQRLIVTFTNVPFCCTTSPPFSSGQIVLYEGTNTIEVYVANQQGNSGGLMTEGIENATGTAAFPVTGRNAAAWTATNSAHRWTLMDAPTIPSAIMGSTTACIGTLQTFSINPSPGATSYTWNFPGGWSGSSTNTAVNATVGASGNVSVAAIYTCGVSPYAILAFSTIPAPAVAFQQVNPAILCSGSSVTISTSGAITYTIEPGSISTGPPFVFAPSASTTYTLFGTDVNNCVSINNPTYFITVNPTPTLTVNSGAICQGNAYTITPGGASSYVVSGGFFIVSPNTLGANIYTVTGIGSNGCPASPVFCTVTVNPLPNVQVSADRTEICRGETITITATGAQNYLWNTGATTSAINVSPNSTINYSVTGTDANNCSNNVAINIKVSSCVGINENAADFAKLVSVYPNPSKGEFTIRTFEASTVEIFDVQGKLIQTIQLNAGNHPIDLSRYASGEYILKATNEQHKQQVILIKE